MCINNGRGNAICCLSPHTFMKSVHIQLPDEGRNVGVLEVLTELFVSS